MFHSVDNRSFLLSMATNLAIVLEQIRLSSLQFPWLPGQRAHSRMPTSLGTQLIVIYSLLISYHVSDTLFSVLLSMDCIEVSESLH